jgi:hypothetical protein
MAAAIHARHHFEAERKERPMRQLLDLLVWTALIAATIGVIMIATPPPKPNVELNPRFMSGPTAEDVIRANGFDPGLIIE